MFHFCRGAGPAQKAKNLTPAPKQKKNNTHPPLPSVFFFFFFFFFFCCLGWWVCSFVFAVWAGCVFCFCCLGGGLFFFGLFGRVRVFLLFERGACVFFAIWAGCMFFGVIHHLPVCLAGLQATQQQKRPNSKKKHRFLSGSTVRYDMVRQSEVRGFLNLVSTQGLWGRK